MARTQSGIITFKVDAALVDALKTVRNRSAFIRSALMSALDGTCPLCGGTGRLSPNQKRHLQALGADHSFRRCDVCNETKLVCTHGRPAPVHRAAPGSRKSKAGAK